MACDDVGCLGMLSWDTDNVTLLSRYNSVCPLLLKSYTSQLYQSLIDQDAGDPWQHYWTCISRQINNAGQQRTGTVLVMPVPAAAAEGWAGAASMGDGARGAMGEGAAPGVLLPSLRGLPRRLAVGMGEG